MKKIFPLIIASILAVTALYAQNGWVTHRGDERISVKFPSEPTEANPGSFTLTGKDSTAYIFNIVDIVKTAGVDSVALAPIKTTPEFAAELKTGMNQTLPDVVFEDVKIGTWKGFTCYNTTGVDPNKKKYYIFMFIIGNKLYSLINVTSDAVGTKNRDDFFTSVELRN
ncbi:MAG: hypothetical protein ACXVA2_09635 [Mucilaginibacter sp.]